MRRSACWIIVCVSLASTHATPALARSYIEDERTASDRIEEGAEGALGRALERRRKRLERRRAFFQQAAPFWRDAHLELRVRSYWFDRLQTNEDRMETWATGGWLSYESGLWRERLSVGATLYTSQRTYGPEDRDGLLMLRPRQKGLTVLGESWAELRIDEETSVRAWRQTFHLPYLNRQDSRMIPNTFQAYVLRRQHEDLGFIVGHVTHTKQRDSRQFVSMAEAAGVDAERGLSMLGFLWQPSEEFTIGAIDYVAWDLMNVLYAEARWSRDVSDELRVGLSTQFTHQTSLGDDLFGGSFSTHHVGLKAKLTWRAVGLSAMAGSTGSGARIRSPWGGRPGYLSLMRQDFDRAGERAFGLGLDVDFAGLGLEGWSGFLRFARGRSADDADTNLSLATRWEFDATLDYRPKEGLLENFWLRFRVAHQHDRGAERTGRDIRVILNYDVPIL